MDGTFVCDGTAGDYFNAKYGVLDRTPLVLEIRAGRLISARSARAELERDFWQYCHTDSNSNRVGELAFGTNLPIPHTAIIPKRKDDIGRSLGDFVQGNFLTPDVIGERLAGAKIAERLGHWLAQTPNAERAGEAAADALGGVVEVLDDRDVQEALGTAVEKRLARTEVAPLLGKAIDVAIDGGHHQRMLDGVMRGLINFLDDNRAMLRDRLDQESPWWVPEAIDDRVFKKIFTGVERFLADVSSTPDHEVRRSIDVRIRGAGGQAARRPGAHRQVRNDEAGAARPPRGAGLAAVALG